jgi:hypothetical protein
MRYLCFIALILSIILTGCSHTEDVLELRGKVLDEKTKVTIPNRQIIVHSVVKNDTKFTTSYAGEFSTDSSGSFSYILTRTKNVYLYDFCIVGDSSYAYSSHRLGLTELNSYGKFLSFNMGKLADLTIRFEKKYDTPFQDTLYVSWSSNGVEGDILYPYKIYNYGNSSNSGFRWIGGEVKSEIKTKAYADKKTKINLTLFRLGQLKEMSDTVTCKRDGTNSVCFIY